MVRITCLGAAESVTGSCFLVEGAKKKFLVDCGLFQGGKTTEERNWKDWDFDPAGIDALFLTHAHIDHSGRIPKLVRDGFRGEIITSPPTAELCRIMLLDSAHVQEMEAEWQSKRRARRGRKGVEPLYTMADAEESLKYFRPVERDQVIRLDATVGARLRTAGHILGASILELFLRDGDGEIKVVFSGDLGRRNQLIVKDPFEITDADYLFIESTYGNRLHRNLEDSKKEFLEAIRYAVSNGEKVIIPVFAVERTQEILYVLGEFYRQGEIPEIPVYLDSPLAIKATEIFRNNKRHYDEEATAIVRQGFDPFSMPTLHPTPTTAESMAINEKKGSAIVLSANGMCTAGRIKHHLKHNLWRPGASVVIVGFQAQGTTGRKIVEGEKKVKIFGEFISVRAKVFTIGGFSAHADQEELLHWLEAFSPSMPQVFVVHGELTASEAFARAARERFSMDVRIPVFRETLELAPRRKPERMEPVAPPADIRGEALETLAGMERTLAKLRAGIQAGREGAVAPGDLSAMKALRDAMERLLTGGETPAP
jgi:metallo-beta-lactamase family protein